MKPDLQRRIQRYGWDKAAPYYETGWQDQLWPAQESLLAEIDPTNDEKILDVSCGTGLVTLPLAEIVAPDGDVTGIDLSEGMIEKARQEAEEMGVDNVSFFRRDAEFLDIPDDTFDVVICSLGLMYYLHPEKAIQEMFRVLKPGGRVGALVWGERKACGWAGIFPIVDRRVKTEVCPLFFQQGTGNVLRNGLEASGFTDLYTTRFSLALHFNSEEEACIAAFLGGAVALAYQKFDEQTRNEVCREYLESIQAYKTDLGYNIPGEFVIATGVK